LTFELKAQVMKVVDWMEHVSDEQYKL